MFTLHDLGEVELLVHNIFFSKFKPSVLYCSKFGLMIKNRYPFFVTNSEFGFQCSIRNILLLQICPKHDFGCCTRHIDPIERTGWVATIVAQSVEHRTCYPKVAGLFLTAISSLSVHFCFFAFTSQLLPHCRKEKCLNLASEHGGTLFMHVLASGATQTRATKRTCTVHADNHVIVSQNSNKVFFSCNVVSRTEIE